MAGVVRHHGQLVVQRRGGNPQVVVADDLAGGSKLAGILPGVPGDVARQVQYREQPQALPVIGLLRGLKAFRKLADGDDADEQRGIGIGLQERMGLARAARV